MSTHTSMQIGMVGLGTTCARRVYCVVHYTAHMDWL